MTTEINNDNWKSVQVKTFTKWINNKLSNAGYDMIGDIFTDCCDGIALINLLQGITGAEIKHNEVTGTKYKKLENNEYLIEFLKKNNLQIVNIRPSDLADGNQKLILGLIWIIILRFGITGLIEENSNSKKALLAWCRAVTEPYSNVDIKNFSNSWKDGLAFNAIIHRFRPDLIENYRDLKSDNALYNVRKAFDVAEKSLDIPKLMDPEDITHAIRPDEKSIFTYVSQYYNKFSILEKEEAAKKRISEFLKRLNWSIRSRNEYERLASQFLDMKNGFEEDESEFRTIVDAFITKFEKRREMASILNKMFLELKSLHGNIEITNSLYQIKKYTPPAHLSIAELDAGVYEAGLSNVERCDSLFEIFEYQFRGNLEDKVQMVENLKKAFDDQKSIGTQIRDLEALKNNLVHASFDELLDPSETISNKISYLEKLDEEIRRKDMFYKHAISLFNECDKNNKKKIHLNDLMKCLKSLNCNLSQALEKKIMEDSPSFFTLEEYLESIDYLRLGDTKFVKFKKDIEEAAIKGQLSTLSLNMKSQEADFIANDTGAIDISKIMDHLVI